MTHLPAASAVGAGAGGDTRGSGFATPALDGMPVMDATEEEQSEPTLSDDKGKCLDLGLSLGFPGISWAISSTVSCCCLRPTKFFF